MDQDCTDYNDVQRDSGVDVSGDDCSGDCCRGDGGDDGERDDFDIGFMLNYSSTILLQWLRWSVLWGLAALGPRCWQPSSMV